MVDWEMDNSPRRWTEIQTIRDLEQSRAMRFRPELLPVLLDYFGLTRGMEVLEVGCGPGTMALYFSEGLAPGHVTGIDLENAFIRHAARKAIRAQISNVSFRVGDAYNLPFEKEAFDAVVSYTSVGVLTDPEKAVREMIRVCRPGGTVSLGEAVSGPWGMGFTGVDSLEVSDSFTGSRRFHQLTQKAERLRLSGPPSGIGSPRWPASSFMGLLHHLRLSQIRFNAWGYGRSPDDYRTTRTERRIIESALSERQLRIGAAHLSPEEYSELIRLTHSRDQWLRRHAACDWDAGLSIVVSGRKGGSLPRVRRGVGEGFRRKHAT